MNFEHDYQLKTKPNLSKRILAAIIDYGIIFSYMMVMFHLYGEPNDEGGQSLNGWPATSVMVIWFIFTVGLEQLFGSTIGNYTQNLRAAPKNDPRKQLTFGQSIKRRLLDPIDMFWPFGLLGILTIKKTDYNQRLGDLWAHTVVLDTSDPEQGLKPKEIHISNIT